MVKIVIADDHPVVRIGARALISDGGIGEVVGEVGTTDALLAALAETGCDVLVTDLNMPGEQPDGILMLATIHRRFPGLPIVLMTVTVNMGILRAAVDAGVLGLVDKSSSLDQLPAAIQAAAAGRKFMAAGLHDRIMGLGSLPEEQGPPLSVRELDVLRLLATGQTVTEIAGKLHRSVATISRQKGNAMRKLGVANDAELFAYLHENGF